MHLANNAVPLKCWALIKVDAGKIDALDKWCWRILDICRDQRISNHEMW